MARPKFNDEQKKDEGGRLKAYFDDFQSRNEGVTQESFAMEMGFSQGLLGQYFRGDTPIPDERLLILGARLGFNPVDFRPSASWLVTASALRGNAKLAQVIEQIPRGEEDYVADILAPIVKRLQENQQ